MGGILDIIAKRWRSKTAHQRPETIWVLGWAPNKKSTGVCVFFEKPFVAS
jgi:hypothetical protein